jgi:hypothetical protein
MSALEKQMIRWYWRQVGGTLVEEFPIVPHSAGGREQFADAVIIRRGRWRIAHWSEVTLEGQDVIVVHARDERLNLALMGHVFFSARLLGRALPRSVYSVALIAQDDAALRPLLEADRQTQVVVCPNLRTDQAVAGGMLLDEPAGE